MFRQRRVAVVIPAFNEADKIAGTIRSVPGFVDLVIVVDDGSGDATAAVARRAARRASGRRGGGGRQVEVIVHARNRGVGGAIATGYARALALGADATAVMAGDGQMDPADLPRLLAPVVDGAADYAKGNRFAWPGGWRQMPPVRLAGSVVLSWLTRAASGVLAAVRLAVWLHGGVASRAGGDRSRADVRALRISERPSGPPGRGRRARRRRARPPGLRASLALGAPAVARGVAARLALVARLRPPPARARRCASGAARARRGGLVHLGLLTTSFPRHAGDYAGSFVGDRAQRLLDEGHTVEVLAAGPGPARAVDGRLTVRRIPAAAGLFYGEGAPEALERGGAIWLGAARFLAALAATAREHQARWEAVESHWLVPCALAASAAAPALRRRAFAHSGDVALLERIPFGRAIARRLASDGTGLCFVSAGLQARFARLCGETADLDLGVVEPLEVPAALFAPRVGPDPALRRRLGLAAPTVLAVGRLVPIKGHVALLHACARARAGTASAASRPEVVILGDGPERARLARLAELLEVPLRLAGAVPRAEVADWLRAADLFAHPSLRLANGRTEGAPIAAREAQAVGIPVVATNEVEALARAIGALSA